MNKARMGVVEPSILRVMFTAKIRL